MIQEIVYSSSPEVKLILSCARKDYSSEQVEYTRELLNEDIDWGLIYQYANTYRVTNLVYSNLKQHFLSLIPIQVRQSFERRYQFSLVRNFALTRDLFTLLESLEQANVDAIPYKGTFLTLDLYGDLGKRSFNDIDIVIKPSDIERVETILETLGYVRTWPKPEASDSIRTTHLRQKYNFRYRQNSTQTILELHWGVLPGYFHSPGVQGFFWESAEKQELAGRTSRYFGDETYLIVLCAHGANHCWLYELNLICDISEYVRTHKNINWEKLLLSARQIKLGKVVGLGLWLAYHVLSADIPPQVLREITEDPAIVRLGNQASLHLLHFRAPRRFYIPRFQFALCEGFEKKLRYLIGLLEPTERDRNAWPLPAAFTWLYYLLRPLRLIREHAGLPAELE